MITLIIISVIYLSIGLVRLSIEMHGDREDQSMMVMRGKYLQYVLVWPLPLLFNTVGVRMIEKAKYGKQKKTNQKQEQFNVRIGKMEGIIFPNGQIDIDNGTKEIIFISKGVLDKDTAAKIFRQAAAIIEIVNPEERTKERIKLSIESAHPKVFTDQQYQELFNFLVARVISRMVGSIPKRAENGTYYW